jgi:arylsulfatase B/arylsulfatase I/J
MLAALDSAIGTIQQAFVDQGAWQNTLCVFTTDNGGPVGALNGKPHGIGGATGSQNWPLRGGKGSYMQGGVRGTAFVHGSMLRPALVGTTSSQLLHVTDLLPTVVEAAGGKAVGPPGQPLDGVSAWRYLTHEDAAPPRQHLLINIERENATTAPGPRGKCTGSPGQYAVVKGRYKLLLGGGGLPNTLYHDGLPYNGTAPVPQGGCLTACSSTGCVDAPPVQVFDVLADEGEHDNLAPRRPDLVAQLMAVVAHYNDSTYVDPLFYKCPNDGSCPTKEGPSHVKTPCPIQPYSAC